MVRRSCFEQAGVFDPKADTVEDWDVWMRVAKFYPIAVLPEVLAHYRQVESSLSKSYERMEPIYGYVIEKNYAFCRDELTRLGLDDRTLKGKSNASAYQCLAWKAIQCKLPDVKQAYGYQSRALNHRPKIIFTLEYWRLLVAIGLKTLLPPKRYQLLQSYFYGFRSRSKPKLKS
jgi:hypothetical protein